MFIMREKTRNLIILISITLLFITLNQFALLESMNEKHNHYDNIKNLIIPDISVTEVWEDEWGDSGLDYIYDVTIDSQNNIYVVSRVSLYHINLRKYDRNGSLIWNLEWSKNNESHYGYDVITDLNDNVYVTGCYYFNETRVNDIILVKFDQSGNELWNKTWGTNQTDIGRAVVINSNNDVYLIGENEDIIIRKYNSSGYLELNTIWDYYSNDDLLNADIDSNDNIYIAVNSGLLKFNSSNEFDWLVSESCTECGCAVDENDNIYLVGIISGNIIMIKYNGSGGEIWQQTWDIGDNENIYGIAIDLKNNIYIAGKIYTGGYEYWDWMLIKINSTGNKEWEWYYNSGRFSEDICYDVATDSFNDIYVIGTTRATYNISIIKLTENFFLSTDADIPDTDGCFNLTWEPSPNVDNYSIYTYNEPIIEINSSHVLIQDGIIGQLQLISGILNGTHYFAVMAQNETQNITSNCISIEIKLFPPFSFSSSTDAGIPDSDGDYNINWDDSQYSDNYSVYVSKNYISEINGSVQEIANGLTGNTYQLKGVPNGTYYYKVVSFNQFGNQSSDNCVKIDVLSSLLWYDVQYSFTDFYSSGMTIDKYGNTYTIGSDQNMGYGIEYTILKYNRTGDLVWIREYGNDEYSGGEDIITDSNGNIYAVGRFYGDFSILKYNNSGDLEWARQLDIGGSVRDFAMGVALDSNEDVLITGITDRESAGQEDIAIMKYDKDGNFQWYKTWGGSQTDFGLGITLDKADNIYISGVTESFGAGDYDLILIKFNKSGGYLWNSTWGTPYEEGEEQYKPVRVALDSNNNSYLVGSLGTVSDEQDMVLVKFDTLGNQIWNWTYGIPDDDDHLIDVLVTSDNEIYVGGHRDDSLIFKLNSSGSVLWNLTFNTMKVERAYGIAFDNNGYIYMNGNYFTGSDHHPFLAQFSLCPLNFYLTTNAEEPDTNGIFKLDWTPSFNARNYTIYMNKSYISEIDPSVNKVSEGLTGLSHIISDYTNGTYYFLVVAYNEFGNFSSNCIQVNISLARPGEFNLTKIAGNPEVDGTFNLNWTASYEANNYSVYQHDGFITTINDTIKLLASGATNNSYSFINTPIGDYYYKIIAFNDFGNRSSNYINVNVSRGPPNAPILSLSGHEDYYDVCDGDGIYSLIWNNAEAANSYSIYASLNNIIQIDGDDIEIINNFSEIKYLIDGIDGNIIWYYAIVAYNEYGSTISNCQSVFTYGGDFTPKPGFFDIHTDADNPDHNGNFNINWDVASDTIDYTLYQSSSFISTIDGNCIEIDSGNTNRSIDFKNYDNGTYYFAVVAFNGNGNRTSKCLQVDIGTYPPGDFLLSHTGINPDPDGVFTLNWNISLGALNYTIFECNQSITEFNTTVKDIAIGLTNNSFIISKQVNGTYYYIIVAYNNLGNISSNCIEIVIHIEPNPPGPVILDHDALDPDPDGSFTLVWNNSLRAENYSLFVCNKSITDFNDTVITIINGLLNNSYIISGLPNGIYYYIIVAYNNLGNISSNCVYILVVNSQKEVINDNPVNPDNEFNILDFFLSPLGIGIITSLIFGLALILAVFTKKKKQFNSKKILHKKPYKNIVMKTEISKTLKSNEVSQNMIQQPKISPYRSSINVYCVSCHSPYSITREEFEQFRCGACGHKLFNVGYFCERCHKIYPLSKDDYYKLQKPDEVLCYVCKNIAKIVKS